MATKKVKTTSRINKQKEIEQKRRKKRKSILITFLILIAIIGIYVYLLQAETFKIKNIEIIGNNQLTQEKIYELSKLKLGDSIFAVPSIVEKPAIKVRTNAIVVLFIISPNKTYEKKYYLYKHFPYE